MKLTLQQQCEQRKLERQQIEQQRQVQQKERLRLARQKAQDKYSLWYAKNPTNGELQVCRQCNMPKPVAYFGKRKKQDLQTRQIVYRLHHTCKECCNANYRRYTNQPTWHQPVTINIQYKE